MVGAVTTYWKKASGLDNYLVSGTLHIFFFITLAIKILRFVLFLDALSSFNSFVFTVPKYWGHL